MATYDGIIQCAICGVSYYRQYGHVCTWHWNTYPYLPYYSPVIHNFIQCDTCKQWYNPLVGHTCNNSSVSYGTYVYPWVSIPQEEYKKLLEDSKQLAEIRRMLGWKI